MDILISILPVFKHALMITVFVFVMMLLVDFIDTASEKKLSDMMQGGTATRKPSYIIVAFLVLALAHFLLCSLAMSAEKVYAVKGAIAVIDTAYDTVVVEIPLGGKRFTVAGALSPDAVLIKAGWHGTLADLVIGDKVIVKWISTEIKQPSSTQHNGLMSAMSGLLNNGT